jgi:hypothetical protein
MERTFGEACQVNPQDPLRHAMKRMSFIPSHNQHTRGIGPAPEGRPGPPQGHLGQEVHPAGTCRPSLYPPRVSDLPAASASWTQVHRRHRSCLGTRGSDELGDAKDGDEEPGGDHRVVDDIPSRLRADEPLATKASLRLP